MWIGILTSQLNKPKLSDIARYCHYRSCDISRFKLVHAAKALYKDGILPIPPNKHQISDIVITSVVSRLFVLLRYKII